MPPSSQAAFKTLSAFKPRQAQEVMGEAEQKYGLEDRRTRLSNLRNLVGNLSSAVEAVDPSVTGRTSGTFTTEGQRSALVAREQQPILSNLAKQQQALGIEQQGFSEAQNLATQMASALMSQDQTTYQRLLDQYNAALAAEQAAEMKRQYEATLAEQRRQFDIQQQAQAAARRAASQSTGYNVDAIRKILANTNTQTNRQSTEEARYQEYLRQQEARSQKAVQNMLGNRGLRVLSTGSGLSVRGGGSLPPTAFTGNIRLPGF